MCVIKIATKTESNINNKVKWKERCPGEMFSFMPKGNKLYSSCHALRSLTWFGIVPSDKTK